MKDHDKEQEATQETSMPTPEQTEEASTAETYFFPNDGGVTAFSCRADSLKEAQERNQEHLETLKKENS